MKRRDLLRTGALAGLAGAAGLRPGLVSAAGNGRGGRQAQARNVIFFAYDGLTWEDIGVARFFARTQLERPLVLQRLLRAGPSGSAETYSLSSVVTDSAAAASAWSTGRKGVNYMLNLYPDGTRLTPMLELARGMGRATGLISTTRITHATPAGFIAAVQNRNFEDEIAEQYLAFGPDVVLGGGARHFLPELRADERDVVADYRNAGYTVVRTAEELAATNASRVLGLFADDHMPFELDRVRQNAGGPSLADMARKGLQILAGAAGGFLALIEAGRIDHASHKSDAAATLHDVLAADEALGVVIDWVDRHPETLLIVASDHATGGGVVYGTGRHYNNSSPALERILRHDASFDYILARLRQAGTRDEVADIVRAHTGVRPDDAQAEALAGALANNRSPVNRVAFQDQPYNTIGHVVYGGGGELHTDRVNVNFATGQHTAGPVPIAAYGKGAAGIEAAFVDNTEPFAWMCAALGIDHRNPVMTEDAARELLTGRASLRQPLAPHGHLDGGGHRVAAAALP
jgi:alkaline phosphatase